MEDERKHDIALGISHRLLDQIEEINGSFPTQN